MHLVVLAVVRCGRRYGYNDNGGQQIESGWTRAWVHGKNFVSHSDLGA